MSSFAKFFGCVAGTSTMVRNLNDVGPINFQWFGVNPVAIRGEVSFDNVNFVDMAGTISYLSVQEVWQANYNPLDRPTNAGLVSYRFTDNSGNSETLSIEFIGIISETDISVDLDLAKYGPKRVKTKQMEIEQFDPRILDELDERKRTRSNGLPTFCSSTFCAGETIEEREQCSRQ